MILIFSRLSGFALSLSKVCTSIAQTELNCMNERIKHKQAPAV